MSTAAKPTRALVVEDCADDAVLLLRQFKRAGHVVQAEVAGDFAAAQALFARGGWDIVLSDFNLPGTRFSDILAMVKAADPDMPVIVVSGAVGEEVAVSLMREGAIDLVLKHNLARLVPAVVRALALAEETHARRDSERRFRDIVEASADWVWETDVAHALRFSSESGEPAEWSDPLRSLGRTHWQAVGADPDTDGNWGAYRRTLEARESFRNFRFSFRAPRGRQYHISMSGVPVFSRSGAFAGYRGIATDETLVVETYLRAEQAEGMFGDAIESIPQGILLLDAEGRISAVNEAYHNLYPQLAGLLCSGTPHAALEAKSAELGLVHEKRALDAGRRGGPPRALWTLSGGRRLLVSEGRMLQGGRVQLHVDISGSHPVSAGKRLVAAAHDEAE